MKNTYIDFFNLRDLIDGVVVKKLTIHRDASGTLVETLRRDWGDVFSEDKAPFAMQYMSQTPSGLARDEDQWHVHKNQKDRFICTAGRIVTAIYDPREDSNTKDKLNLFVMGPEKEEEMYMVVIPENTYHGFMAISKEPANLLNFPTQLYTGEDEGRVKHEATLWNIVRNDFKL